MFITLIVAVTAFSAAWYFWRKSHGASTQRRSRIFKVASITLGVLGAYGLVILIAIVEHYSNG
jgi:hypothetical protein